MSVSTNTFSITSVPQSVIASDPSGRIALFTVDFGQVFLGPTNAVNAATGYAINANHLPVVFPVAANTAMWAVASSPVTLHVTVSDEGLANSGVRTTPVSGSVDVVGSVAVGNFPAIQATQTARTSLTASAPVSVTVGTSSISLVAANANRKGLRIRVIGTNTVSLSFGGVAAVANKGVVLTGGQTDTFEMGEYTFTVSEARAIASAASTVVAVQEFV